MPQSCMVFLIPVRCELTRHTILLIQIFDSIKWPTVLVCKVKGKPCHFKAYLCGSLYATFKTSFRPYAFDNKRFQMLFLDQLARSKATGLFNTRVAVRFMSSSMVVTKVWSSSSRLTDFRNTLKCLDLNKIKKK